MCRNLTEVTEVLGKGMGILQNVPKFRVRHGSVTEFTKSPRIVKRAYRTHPRFKNDIPVPRVIVAQSYGASRTSWYVHECRTERAEVLGTGMNVLQNLQKFFTG